MYAKLILAVLAIIVIVDQFECTPVGVDIGESLKPVGEKVACGLDSACQELFRCPDLDYFNKPARCWWNRPRKQSIDSSLCHSIIVPIFQFVFIEFSAVNQVAHCEDHQRNDYWYWGGRCYCCRV